MSRGQGKVQRAIVAFLESEADELRSTHDVVCAVFGDSPSEAQTVSTRRALRRLAATGAIIAIGRGWRDRNARWATLEGAVAYHQRMAAFHRNFRGTFGL